MHTHTTANYSKIGNFRGTSDNTDVELFYLIFRCNIESIHLLQTERSGGPSCGTSRRECAMRVERVPVSQLAEIGSGDLDGVWRAVCAVKTQFAV
jgi:hypothetical protein